jgi:lysophospholipase
MQVFTLKFNGVFSSLSNALKDIAKKIGDKDDDIADWSPNPFYKWNPTYNPSAGTKNLTLVDGGEDGQNVPLYPHIQPIRGVDILFAIDSSADSGNGEGWPNGTSLIATYERSKNVTLQNGTAFPAIPDINTFINLGLNSRPTFFGCDSKNQSGPSPLIVYIANHPYSFLSNITTFTTTINNTERNQIIQNGYNVATMGNGTIEQEWPVCVGCAILSRSFERTQTTVPQACQDCFKRHCWNGTLDTRPVKFEPPLGGSAAKTPSLAVKAPSPGGAKPKKSAADRRSVKGYEMALLSLSFAVWRAL